MNQQLYKLLCSMLPYGVKIGYKDNGGNSYSWNLDRHTFNLLFHHSKKHHKPILTSKLSKEDYKEFSILYYGTIGLADEFKKFFEKLTSYDLLPYGIIKPLYKKHFAFDTDKSLYIEKT